MLTKSFLLIKSTVDRLNRSLQAGKSLRILKLTEFISLFNLRHIVRILLLPCFLDTKQYTAQGAQEQHPGQNVSPLGCNR